MIKNIKVDMEKLKACDEIRIDKETLEVTYLYQFVCEDCGVVELGVSKYQVMCDACIPC